MKPLFLVTLSLILFNSCLECNYNIYTIENKTAKHIVIEGYALQLFETGNFDSIHTERIEIKPHSIYSVQRGLGECDEYASIFGDSFIDSVNIIFNNERIDTYVCYDEPRNCRDRKNLLSIDYFTQHKPGGKKPTSIYTYTITEEDYSTAGEYNNSKKVNN